MLRSLELAPVRTQEDSGRPSPVGWGQSPTSAGGCHWAEQPRRGLRSHSPRSRTNVPVNPSTKKNLRQFSGPRKWGLGNVSHTPKDGRPAAARAGARGGLAGGRGRVACWQKTRGTQESWARAAQQSRHARASGPPRWWHWGALGHQEGQLERAEVFSHGVEWGSDTDVSLC